MNEIKVEFNQLLLFFQELYSDVTIACEEKYIAGHKLVLSACSDYFKEIFSRLNSICPVVVLKDIKIREFEAIINFIYNGEVDVDANDVDGFLRAADCLKIKGLTTDEVSEGNESNKRKTEVNDGRPFKIPKITKGVSKNGTSKPTLLLKQAKENAIQLTLQSSRAKTTKNSCSPKVDMISSLKCDEFLGNDSLLDEANHPIASTSSSFKEPDFSDPSLLDEDMDTQNETKPLDFIKGFALEAKNEFEEQKLQLAQDSSEKENDKIKTPISKKSKVRLYIQLKMKRLFLKNY